MAVARQPATGSTFNRLRVLRVERGLSRQAVADAVGVNFQTVGYIERGDYSPSLELALRLAAYFSLPVEAIFSLRPFAPMSDELYGPQENTRAQASRARRRVSKRAEG